MKTTIYTCLVEKFGEERVKEWVMDRRAEESAEIEDSYCELRDMVRAYYESMGVDWQNAPTV